MKVSRQYIFWGGLSCAIVIGYFLVYYKRRPPIPGAIDEVKELLKGWIKPVLGKITSGFGSRIHPVSKKKKFHNGIDLAIPSGTKITAPMDGVVAEVYSNSQGGNQLIIRHSNGYITGYAHLNRSLVKKGDRVLRGDTIALSGNSGKSTGPHLHFTMKDATGVFIDPEQLLYT